MAVYYVDASRPDNSGDGLSPATAKQTIRAARNLLTGGDTILIRAGYCYAPDNGNFLTNPTTGALGLIVDAYGTASDLPIWDALTYEPPGATGWINVVGGVWKKVFGAFNARRLFAGSRSYGILTTDRVVGPALRRALPGGSHSSSSNPSEASIIAALNSRYPWFPGGATTSYALYVFTGSSNIPPPDYYGGLAFVQGDAVSYGVVNAIQLSNVSNVQIRNQHIRGSASAGIRLQAASADVRDTSNILVEDVRITHLYSNGVLTRAFATATPTNRNKDCVFQRLYVDYNYSDNEQETTNAESTLSGTSDGLSAGAGSDNITFDKCVVVNSGHVGIVIGSDTSGTQLPTNCKATRCEVLFSSYTAYSRGFAVYNGTGHFVAYNTIKGQNTRTQIAGDVLVSSNRWLDCRRSIRKPGTAQWIACESYVFDSGSAGGDTVRYIPVSPTNVRVFNNLAEGVIPDDYIQFNSFDTSFPISSTWGSINLTNNVVSSASSTTVLRTSSEGGLAPTISNPVFNTNLWFNGTTGTDRMVFNGTPGGVNGFAWATNNLETNPRLASGGYIDATSPAYASGTYTAILDNNCNAFYAPPSRGAFEVLRPRTAR